MTEEHLARLGDALLRGLYGLEQAFRRLHPPRIPQLREEISELAAALAAAREGFLDTPGPTELRPVAEHLDRGAEALLEALLLFAGAASPEQTIARILGSMRRHCRAQETLYTLRRVLPPLGCYFLEPHRHAHVRDLDPEPPEGFSVGIHLGEGPDDGRGGFALYVPEHLDGRAPRPLVVALHGGSGDGRNFLWSWLREARSRGFLLLAPTSRGSTWSLNAPEVDRSNLESMVAYVCEQWNGDRARVLLTGLSDGATYSLRCGLQAESPFTALAPVSGVLHPAALSRGGREAAAGRRIYLVHGALDWMFPVPLARIAHEELTRAGADVVFREVPDLSHTYPREENAAILAWFDPTLSAPTTSGDASR